MRLFFTIVLLAFLLAFQATGQVIHIPEDYSTIQAGIDAANEGDTVLVSPGTYYENIFITGKNITLASYFLTTNAPVYISLTIIDGGQNGSVIIIDQGIDQATLIKGFTIMNGFAEEGGGGIYVFISEPTISDCIIQDNTALTAGGGICLDAGYYEFIFPHLINLKIFDNSADYGGGIAVLSYMEPVFKGVSVYHNTAGHGGGIAIGNTEATFDAINRCNIYENLAVTGNDIAASYADIDVILDTFTVMDPTEFHAANLESYTFDILNSKFQQVDADLFVSPGGDNTNSGLTTDDPIKTIHHAMTILLASESDQRQIHLLDGTYSPGTNGEFFPVALPDYVHLSGTADSLVILDADSSARVMQITENDTNHISDLTLKGGFAETGAGLYIQNTDPHLERLIITGNRAVKSGIREGGGIYCTYSDPVMNDLFITNNTAGYLGGGIYLDQSFPRVHDVDLGYNTAGYGGGISISQAASKMVLEQVTIHHNQAATGAGIMNDGFLVLQDCNIFENSGNNKGGGIYSYDSIWIFNTNLTGNSSGSGGGLYVNADSYAYLDTADLSGNTAADFGGGLYCGGESVIHLNQVDIKNNISQSRAGGIYCATSDLFLKKTLIAYNQADDYGGGLYCDSYVHPRFDSIDRCNIYLNHAGYANDIMALDTVTVMVDTFSVMHPTDYHANYLKNINFDILNFKVAQADADLYISPGGNDDNSGLTPEYPLKTIDRALLILRSGSAHQHTIHLANGVYSPLTNGERFPVQMSNYCSMAGESRDLTILDAMDSSGVISLAYDTIPLIRNMTVTGGKLHSGAGISTYGSEFSLYNLKITGNHSNFSGGAISISSGSKANLENLVIENNSASEGGGIKASHTELVLKNVDFISNSAVTGAGTSFYYCDSVIMENINFTGNVSVEYGGGIYSIVTDLILTNALFDSNNASRGGGIWAERASVEVKNSLFSNNTADNGFGSAAIIYDHQSPYDDYELKFINSTFTDNSYPGLYLYSGNANLVNDIIWGNDGSQQIYYFVSGGRHDTLTVLNTNIQGGQAGIFIAGPAELNWLSGNIDEDPQFLLGGDYPYSLDAGSLCIDTGTPDTTGLYLPYNDLIGNTRVWDGNGDGVPVIDMGPYEYGAPVSVQENIPGSKKPSLDIHIWPNPASDHLYLIFPDNDEGMEIIFMNNLGQVMETETVPAGRNSIEIPLHQFSQGIYTVLIKNGKGEFTVRNLILIP